mgnify:CR=1 FL=1
MPVIVFIIVNNIITIGYIWKLYKDKEYKWCIVVAVYLVIFNFFTTFIIGKNLMLLSEYADIEETMEKIAVYGSWISFLTGLPFYILSFILLIVGFIWTAFVRKQPMWVVCKWISLILIIIGLVAAFITWIVSGVFAADISQDFYFIGIVGSFMSAYQFIVNFMNGILGEIG